MLEALQRKTRQISDMLYLLFRLGNDRYALPIERVVEILPVVSHKAIPGAPQGVAGIFNYHGTPVPVIDIGMLALGRSAPMRMSTRIVVVEFHERSGSSNGEDHLLGLIVEEATSTLRRSLEQFTEAGIEAPATPYLGPVTMDDGHIVQKVEIDQLLPEEICDLLFRQTLEAV